MFTMDKMKINMEWQLIDEYMFFINYDKTKGFDTNLCQGNHW